MTDLTGQELEDFGQEVFTRMGLTCIHALNQARLRDLDPPGPYSADDHLEFDYLIPCGEICLIGEITGRSSPNSVRTKYSRFRRHYGVVRNLQLTGQVWQLLGVPSEHLRDFRGVTELKCFFVTTRLERFDVNLPEVDNMARFYKPDWDLLVEYSHSIGIYAKHHFLYHFDVAEGRSHRPLMLCRSPHGLMRTTDRKIASGNVGLADVYTFEVSPYDLLPIARVFRRDELPNLAPAPEPEYQRPLMPDKLDSIRGNLLDSPDFMFPNSILVVLSSDCRYLEEEEALMIPDNYGAVSVIDGQHRLFSYADEGVRARIDDGSRIVVTAVFDKLKSTHLAEL